MVSVCAITGLPIADGSAAWLVLLDDDHATGAAPHSWWGFESTPVMGTYEENRFYPDESTPQGVEQHRAMLANVGRSHSDSYRLSDYNHILISVVGFEFLPTLPLPENMQEPGIETLQQYVTKYTSTVYSAVEPFAASEVHNCEKDSAGAENAWMDVDPLYNNGKRDQSIVVGGFLGSRTELANYVEISGWLYMLRNAYAMLNRELVPATESTDEAGDHVQIDALARFTRRKAIAAGFAPA